jgi:PAS domain S-box-containing protein
MATEPDAKKMALRLQAIIDSTVDSILSTDREGIVATWNAAAESLFGYRSDEVVGVSNLLLIPPAYHDEIRKLEAKVMRGERIDNLQSQMLRKGGGRIDIAATISDPRFRRFNHRNDQEHPGPSWGASSRGCALEARSDCRLLY